MASSRKANVLIADGEPVTRAGLISLINSHPCLRVCAESDSLEQTRWLCGRDKPRVLIVDALLGDVVCFIKDLRRWSRETRVVVFAAHGEALDVQRAFKAGACGYVLRRDPVESLMAAVLGALVGERHVSPRVQHQLLENLACGAVELHGSEMSVLSNRELQVFRLIGQGMVARTMASELHLSVKTIETHRQRIKQKLCLSSGVELQRRAVLFHAASRQ